MDQLLSFPDPAARGYRITVLGPFSLWSGGLTVDTRTWRPRALALLRLLAVAPEGRRPREEVIDLLWPEVAPEAGPANLRDLVRRVRRAAPDGAALVVLAQGWVALNLAYPWEVDLARFEDLVRGGGRPGPAGGGAGHLPAVWRAQRCRACGAGHRRPAGEGIATPAAVAGATRITAW
jgi:hypothetical protein